MYYRSKKLVFLALAVLCLVILLVRQSFHLGFLSLQPIWQLIDGSDFYLVNKNWVLSHAEDLGVSAIKSLKFDTSVDMVVDLLQYSKKPYFEELRQAVIEKYESVWKILLKSELQAQVTNGICAEADASFESIELVQSKYLQNNKQKIKMGILQNIAQSSQNGPLENLLQSQSGFGVDKGLYFRTLFQETILDHLPTVEGVYDGKPCYGSAVNDLSPLYSKDFLLTGRTKVTDRAFDDLKAKHSALVKTLRKLSIPSLSIFQGSGILIAASPKHFTGALNIIVQAREMGSKLPVELVMDRLSDYNKELCEETIPLLNGKCIIIEQVLGTDFYQTLKLEDFQNKVLAQLISSFDHTIFLDSDSFPIKNIDTLFESEPYLRTKFVLWRDMWHKSTSPVFYDIIGLKEGEVVQASGLLEESDFASYAAKNKESEVMYHDLDGIPSIYTVESGQMVYSKREHFRSMLLAFYYNYYGPSHYYKLIYQGGFGVGDKDTFVPALHVMSEPYYLTEFQVTFAGIKKQKEGAEGTYLVESTMVQRDPEEAAIVHQQWKEWLAEQGLDTRLNFAQNTDFMNGLRVKFEELQNGKKRLARPSAMFLHVHNPKINSLNNELTPTLRYDYKSRYLRGIGDFDDILGPKDWELKFQSINAWVTCEGLTGKEFWGNFHLSQEEICEKSKDYLHILKQDSNDVLAGALLVIPDWLI